MTAWPLMGLVIESGAVELRLPTASQIGELAALAATGVHAPTERPFLTPWAEASPDERDRFVRRRYWQTLGTWKPDSWRLCLGVFVDAQPTGVVELQANDFSIVREVRTSSWLGIDHHGQGFGTAARVGLLTLAFDHLGAASALTEVFPDNRSSQGVSRKLGYEPDGVSFDRRGDEALVSDRLRLSGSTWHNSEVIRASVRGLGPCRGAFGLETHGGVR